jgi:hypothetical protein
MLKKNNLFDKHLNTRHVHEARGGPWPGDRHLGPTAPAVFSYATYTLPRHTGRHGVNPEPPEGIGAASDLPFKRETRTSGAVSGEAA